MNFQNITKQFWLTVSALLMLASCVCAQAPATPGTPLSASAEAGDQKLGSILLFNFFSSTQSEAPEETEFGLTNTNETQAVNLRLFLINGVSGAVTNRLISLAAGQTTSILASQVAPSIRGYAVAVAVNSNTGCPISFNFLRGSALIKLSSGHSAKLNAEAYAALYSGTLASCNIESTTARLNFNGKDYNLISRTVSVPNLASRSDGYNSILVLNRLNGNLSTGLPAIGIVSGLMFDDSENTLIFSSLSTACQISRTVDNNFPRLSPRYETFVPAGRAGWLTAFATNGTGLTGAILNFNPNISSQSSAFSGGQNLSKVTLNANGDFLEMPVLPIRGGFTEEPASPEPEVKTSLPRRKQDHLQQRR